MATILLVVVGACAGAVMHGIEGLLAGAALGFLCGSVQDLRRRIVTMEGEMAQMKKRLAEAPVASGEFVPATPAFGDEVTAEIEPALDLSPSRLFSGMSQGEVQEVEAVSGKMWAADEERFTEVSSMETEKAAESSLISNLGSGIERHLTGGNLLVKMGVVILFLGVAFLLRYVAERNWLSIEIRLIGAALGALALIGIGWRLRLQREKYALVLQGGGIGILYITVFTAFRIYHLVPPAFTFALFVALAVLSAALAVLQNSCSLAVLGVSGGFLAPVLASTGEGSHVMLFSYYALLNASVLAVAWFRAWRILNLLGFIFTFAVGSSWGYRYYQPQYFSTTEPFLILFFLFYVAVAVLFAVRQPPRLRGYVDASLVFGTPVIAFALQTTLVKALEHGIAWSSYALGCFYIGLAWLLFRKGSKQMRTLTEAFLAIGVAFGTLVIPLAMDYEWTASVWALEGAAILWVGVRQRRLLARVSGLLLQMAAGVAFLQASQQRPSEILFVLNGYYLSCLCLSIAGLVSSLFLYRHRKDLYDWDGAAGVALGVWGLAWWFGAGTGEIAAHYPGKYVIGSVLLFTACSCLACDTLQRRLDWPFLKFPALGLLPGMVLVAVVTEPTLPHPFSGLGFAAWPFAFGVYYLILRNHDTMEPRVLKWLHVCTLWLLVLIAAWELSWQTDIWVKGAGTWSLIAWGLVPAAFVLLVATIGRKLPWPVARHYEEYLTIGVGPLGLYTWLWVLAVNASMPGDPWPLPYIPLLNPLDVAIGFIFASLFAWYLEVRSTWSGVLARLPSRLVPVIYALCVFYWMNAIAVRTIHHWSGVAFSFHAMFGSTVFQAFWSIFWSLCALGLMVFSTRRRLRTTWMSGAAMLMVVLVKLFLVDMSNTGTVERIVTFIGVGILLLIIGYLSPVPPRDERGAFAK